ncbi:MAG TPA: protein kinase [Gemmatimonadaceae bacterium]|nr:protein kinase [Gemmatimonadaceae bacterium]
MSDGTHTGSELPPASLTAASDGALPNVCPVCGLRYASSDRFCANDGQPLRSQQPQTDPLIGTVVGDRYFIERRLGQGGMGVVYLAEHVRIGRKCAIKVLRPEYLDDPDAVTRFQREAANLSRVNHPNIAGLFDYGESAGRLLYLAMEYADGEALVSMLQREGFLSPGRVAGIVAQTSAALRAAHELGIVHRDLKPENLIVAHGPNDTEIVKVVDFGIARAVKETAQRVTMTGAVVGTLAYMSPEQISGEEVDSRSDLYSLALVTYMLLTGKLPFKSDTAEDITRRCVERPAPLSVLAPDVAWPGPLQLALDRALQPDRERRYESTNQFARDVIDALETWQPGIVSPLIRAIALLSPDVAAALSPEVVVRHATPDAKRISIEATGRRRGNWIRPMVIGAATIAATVTWLAIRRDSTIGRVTATVAPSQPDSQPGLENSASPAVKTGNNRDTLSSAGRADPASTAPRATPQRATGQSTAGSTVGRVASATDRQASQPRQTPAPAQSEPVRADTQITAPPNVQEVSPLPVPTAPTTGIIRIGTRESGVVLFVGDRADGPLTRLSFVSVPPGTVRLRLRAEHCQDWDSTMTVRAGDTLSIGYRRPQC